MGSKLSPDLSKRQYSSQGRTEEEGVERLRISQHPIFPGNASLVYMDEGAANIVYRLQFIPSDAAIPLVVPDTYEFWDRKLLRLRKDLPTTDPCIVAQYKFQRYIVPWFQEEWLVKQDLVGLKASGIIAKLNKELNGWDVIAAGYNGGLRQTPRPQKREGVFLADDDFGLLVEDMSANSGDELIEFKPKWLTQSPDAPRDSKRCRNCAINARRAALTLRNNPNATAPQSFCPLSLMSNDYAEIYRVVKHIIGFPVGNKFTPNHSKKLARFSAWVKNSPLLLRLKNAQEMHDRMGVLNTDDKNTDILIAMTLRDVTCYLSIPGDESQPLVAKLGDLDVKSINKLSQWKQTESELIDEGWYEGSECEGDRQPLECWLYPLKSTANKDR